MKKIIISVSLILMSIVAANAQDDTIKMTYHYEAIFFSGAVKYVVDSTRTVVKKAKPKHRKPKPQGVILDQHDPSNDITMSFKDFVDPPAGQPQPQTNPIQSFPLPVGEKVSFGEAVFNNCTFVVNLGQDFDTSTKTGKNLAAMYEKQIKDTMQDFAVKQNFKKKGFELTPAFVEMTKKYRGKAITDTSFSFIDYPNGRAPMEREWQGRLNMASAIYIVGQLMELKGEMPDSGQVMINCTHGVIIMTKLFGNSDFDWNVDFEQHKKDEVIENSTSGWRRFYFSSGKYLEELESL